MNFSFSWKSKASGNMKPQDLIRKKRSFSTELSAQEIESFVAGVCDGSWSDAQIGAMLMAMFINGLTQAEQKALVQAMIHSGETLDFSDIDIPKADKHSTGGIGDKTSLIIAPLAAACGLAVPMISGRGLGHTGGTLDKLESIKGYNVNLTKLQIYEIIKTCGFALAGQTENLVPADKKLYALRDETATIESPPLIVASIMSKKLAEDLDALVLDVKTGNGAFMSDLQDASCLARAMVETGKNFGVKTIALITDMNQPLGKFVGNHLEVYECLKIMRGETDSLMKPTLELSVQLTARLLVLANITKSLDEAIEICYKRLEDGSALEKFRLNVQLQGGDPSICDEAEKFMQGTGILKVPVRSDESGFIVKIQTKEIGEAICEIGGGRRRSSDKIDHEVGFECLKKIGDRVEAGEEIGVIYCRNDSQALKIGNRIKNAYKVSAEQLPSENLIKAEIS
jgi:pyrimidine-nucleoside phosphorylase